MSTYKESLDAMGKRILNAARTELYLAMHFCGPALNSLGYEMDVSTPRVGTDAAYIRFNPTWLMETYLDHPYLIDRVYMHMIMHCIFRHMFAVKAHHDTELWDLCCDIAVESIVDSMDVDVIRVTQSDFREEWYARLTGDLKVLTAEKLYRWFIEKNVDYSTQLRLAYEFGRDDHSFWLRLQDDDTDRNDPEQDQNPPPAPRRKPPEEQEDDWKKNAKRMQIELETFGHERSDETGNLERVLSFENKKRDDFREYLRRFAVIREESHIDPDSFDYGFYNYGMELYGNMPLMEENEYREAKKIEELVIAIDTSASCQATLVQKFLNDTASILESEETFFHRVNVHIIECDDQVQNDLRLTDVGEIRRYAKGFTLHGGMGTDFRPVFEYIERCQRDGQLTHLKGLLYFTDGFGIYPEKPTKYDTAFVFQSDEEMNDRDVPDWAMKLYVYHDRHISEDTR